MTNLVIGAGIAGLACARRLADAGEQVIVVDKGRGLGGRLATRRSEAGVFDHGAQYVTARAPAFQAYLDQAKASGAAGLWPRRGASDDWWVGTPGMSSLVRPLAEGLDVRSSHRVRAIRRDGAGWVIDLDQPEAATLTAERLVLAIPAPQAQALLADVSDLARRLDPVTYAPCWTLMLSLAAPLDPAPDLYRVSDGPCAWMVRNASKPDRPGGGEDWVIQAGPHWSDIHLELDPQDASARLCDAFRDWAGTPANGPIEIRHAVAHRWRHARVTQPLGEPCLWDTDRMIGLAGDWCLGPRVEAAFLSGHRLAEAMLDDQAARQETG